MLKGVIYKMKEMTNVLAMLWVQQIVNGKKTYAQVPRLLKSQVAELLRDAGLEELVE